MCSCCSSGERNLDEAVVADLSPVEWASSLEVERLAQPPDVSAVSQTDAIKGGAAGESALSPREGAATPRPGGERGESTVEGNKNGASSGGGFRG